MKYLTIFIIIVAIIFIYEYNKDTNMTPLKSTNSILAMGDSLTYGYNANPEESYPSLLSKRTGLTVINAGVPAETSHDGLRRLPKLLEDDSIKLMILFFGGNDIIQQLSMESLKTNLTMMIQMAKRKHIHVLLVAVPNMSLFGFRSLSLYDEIADEQDVPLLTDMFADILEQPSLKSDQIHPNALGYKQMANEIYHALKEHGWIE